MKICEIISFDIIKQQVIYIQGYKNAKSVMKNFQKGDAIYDLIKDVVDDDYEELIRTCNGWVHTITDVKSNTMLPVLIMSDKIDISDPKDLSILAHEIVHVVQKIRNRFFQQGETEFEAYIYEYLFFKILNIIKENNG